MSTVGRRGLGGLLRKICEKTLAEVIHSEKLHETPDRSHMKGKLNPNLSGDEVCFTNPCMLLVKNMLCSELHCQSVLV